MEEPKKTTPIRKTIPIHEQKAKSRTGMFSGKVVANLTSSEYQELKKNAQFGDSDPHQWKKAQIHLLEEKSKQIRSMQESIATLESDIQKKCETSQKFSEGSPLKTSALQLIEQRKKDLETLQMNLEENKKDEEVLKKIKQGDKFKLLEIHENFEKSVIELGNAVEEYMNAVIKKIKGSEEEEGKESAIEIAQKKVQKSIESVKASSSILPGFEELEKKIQDYEAKVEDGDKSEETRCTLDSLKGLRTILLSERYGLKASDDKLSELESSEVGNERNKRLGQRFEVLRSSIERFGPASPLFEAVREKMKFSNQEIIEDNDINKRQLNALESVYQYAQDLKGIESLLAMEAGFEEYQKNNKDMQDSLQKLVKSWVFPAALSFLEDLIIKIIHYYFTSRSKEAEEIRNAAINELCKILGIPLEERMEIIDKFLFSNVDIF